MLSRIRTRLRAMVGDEGTDTFQQVESYFTSSTFGLIKNASAVTSVTVNGTATTNYTFSDDDNTVAISDTLTIGDVIIINYTYYQYTDAEMNKYIRLALSDLSTYADLHFEIEGTQIYPKMDNRTQTLIARLALIRINPDYAEYRTPNLTVKYPKSKDVDEKVEKLIAAHFANSEFFGYVEL